jgi:hypothetical protein
MGGPGLYNLTNWATRVLRKLAAMEPKHNCLGGPTGIALEGGAQQKDLEILQVLLESGLDINTVGGYLALQYKQRPIAETSNS